ncbi:hypothetical protein G6F55_000169 [Rhizopus delemar]|uniref:ER membrane protein complex subunit 4 n=2 Tax=Rhizopus TaxID=4842 RepID=A0A9P6Z4L3_9FUNG|nr:hypothetical protein G6F55_000169 [Rhizopus delemar]KAG1527261.1 hypothetical protein G6F52_001697 [Rhizopus delemar]KAG1553971.1 hypothetical protein G6F51_000266 [Rhizopus arrhizus]KAG1570665.1 hypothetical protein G6F50_005288 [Rhizopus delemar]KAG1637665.1 hypothetical protein G6F45_000374 [Rhizopus arrhizus]
MDSTAIQPDIAQNFLPVTVFLAAWHVRVTWIAFTTLWVFWGLIWFLRHAFGGDGSHINQTNAQAYTNPPATATDPETGAAINTGAANTGPATGPATNQKKFLAAPAWGANVFRRVNRAHDMLRDLILMLLSVLVINSFARGSTRAVMILAWIMVHHSNSNQTYASHPKLPNPIGFQPSTLQKYSKSEKSTRHSDKDDQAALKMRRAWDVALVPAKSIPMSLFMMYMSGNSLQIFSVMITATMLFMQPIKAIMSAQETFSRFESTGSKKQETDLTLPKLSFIGLQLIVILLGVYRVNSMGLLPNTTSDWLSFIKPKEILEFAAQ